MIKINTNNSQMIPKGMTYYIVGMQTKFLRRKIKKLCKYFTYIFECVVKFGI